MDEKEEIPVIILKVPLDVNIIDVWTTVDYKTGLEVSVLYEQFGGLKIKSIKPEPLHEDEEGEGWKNSRMG